MKELEIVAKETVVSDCLIGIAEAPIRLAEIAALISERVPRPSIVTSALHFNVGRYLVR